MSDILAFSYALIQGCIATFVRDPEMLDIFALQLNIELATSLVDTHMQHHIVGVLRILFLYQLIDFLVYLLQGLIAVLNRHGDHMPLVQCDALDGIFSQQPLQGLR